MNEIDIWRSAQQLIKMYGLEAELAAAQRADKAVDQGNPEGGLPVGAEKGRNQCHRGPAGRTGGRGAEHEDC
jgi:hypothetical protein